MRQLLIAGLLLFSVIRKSESEAVTGLSNDFAQRLMKTETSENKGNLIISPLVTVGSLGLIGLGACEKTFEVINKNIRFPGNNSLENNLEYLYTSIIKHQTNLGINTTFYVPEGVKLISEFYTKLGNIFAATIETDNSGDDKGTPKNSRVKTSIKSEDGLTLTHDIKICFTGNWMQNPQRTEDTFYGYNENRKVKSMRFTGRYLHGKIDALKSDVVVMGFNDTHNVKYSFVIVLPREARGLDDLLLKTNELDIKEILYTLDEVKNMTVQFPFFTINKTYDLEQNLKDLDMGHMFGENASFCKITRKQHKFHVDSFKQNIFFDVNLFGITTSKKKSDQIKDHKNHKHRKVPRKTMKSLNNHSGDDEFRVNHPFLFFIVSQKYDIVFEGTVVMPEY